MTTFALFAALLMAAVLALLLPPLWFRLRPRQALPDQRQANLAIFRDQLSELERERSEGTLAAADFEQAQRELQRRLLDEVSPDEATQAVDGTGSRKTAIAILLLLPLSALTLYLIIGTPRALDPTQTAPQAPQSAQEMTPEKINAMVESLAARLKDNPDDTQGWLMLARSYKMQGRYAEAGEAFAKVEKVVDQDPDLLAMYAETLAMAAGKGLAGKPRALVEKALKLNPQHGHSLFLAGAAAIESGDKRQAIRYWEALLPQVEPGSELDQMLRDGLDKLKAQVK